LAAISGAAPDEELYPDYQLDDYLAESMIDETQLFFAELIKNNLHITNVVSSDFAILNERRATHYKIPDVTGVEFRRVSLPKDSLRGGLLTEASVLKVTANGTTTSPVKRGAWIMARILGKPPTPPPHGTPAIEPDIRGATTIREQFAKHRADPSCNSCHRSIDPPGLALENFDVMGGWRDKYRAIVEGVPPVTGIGKGGLKFTFHYAQPVDPSGQLWDGRAFGGIQEFKKLLLQDEPQIARNLAGQLAVYATGAPVRFSDRAAIERILDRTRGQNYAVKSLILEIVQSELFLHK
jgi:hypothetical protein